MPTGNFGDILAADYAGKAGLPVGRLICASNENNVLTDFINTGVYDVENRPFYKTITPSMDILVSSNLERLLFDLSGCDGARVARFMGDLAGKKRYAIDEAMKAALQKRYFAGCVDEAGRGSLPDGYAPGRGQRRSARLSKGNRRRAPKRDRLYRQPV